jgi:hypothetical protein
MASWCRLLHITWTQLPLQAGSLLLLLLLLLIAVARVCQGGVLSHLNRVCWS